MGRHLLQEGDDRSTEILVSAISFHICTLIGLWGYMEVRDIVKPVK